MRTIVTVALVAACGLAVPSFGQHAAAGEIAYPRGSLGYDALMRGDPMAAEAQLRANTSVSANDPARLINLGRALEQTGRHAEAMTMYRAAIDSPKRFDLVLASGRVMDSRLVAKTALRRLETGFAQR